MVELVYRIPFYVQQVGAIFTGIPGEIAGEGSLFFIGFYGRHSR
jgi:hypothetical protein